MHNFQIIFTLKNANYQYKSSYFFSIGRKLNDYLIEEEKAYEKISNHHDKKNSLLVK